MIYAWGMDTDMDFRLWISDSCILLLSPRYNVDFDLHFRVAIPFCGICYTLSTVFSPGIQCHGLSFLVFCMDYVFW